MRISSALLVAGLAAGLSAAASAETEGWYFGADTGLNLAPKIKFDANAETWHETQNPGYAVLGQVGYGFGQIRLEGEVGYRKNDVDAFDTATTSGNGGGGIGGTSVMANAYYDFATGSKWTPFVGVGLGGMNVSADHITVANVPVTNSSEFVFAYQGIAGVSYALNDHLSLKADYHYTRTEKADLDMESTYGAGNAAGTYSSHSLMVGFTVKLGEAAAPVQASAPMPPPPAPPAPPPAPAPKPVVAAPIAKNFMVFFDFDKDALTPEAKAIIMQAANAAKQNHSATIALTGYTDLAGTTAYNLKLSVRRGDAVKKALVALGIPANEISVVGKGKSDPLVPTKDGVREAQNRRVQIVLQ